MEKQTNCPSEPLYLKSQSKCDSSITPNYVGLKISEKELILIMPFGEEISCQISKRSVDNGRVCIETKEGIKVNVEMNDDQIKLICQRLKI